jgi:PiT family inorganic phosphate transporter
MSMDPGWLIVMTVGLLLLFDLTNGFHDTANMIGTVVATQAMTPLQALLLVSLFTLLGPFLGGTAVANVLGEFVQLGDLPPGPGVTVILSGVLGAISWNLLTWRYGLPSSASHALVGGLIGAVLIATDPQHVVWGWDALAQGHWLGLSKIVAALLFSPVLGMALGFILLRLARWLLRAARPGINHRLRQAQWLGTAGLAFAYGANDAQKGMGVITLVLLLGHRIDHFEVPTWVILACVASITAGASFGGWRIVRTLGFGIYRLRPLHSLASQIASATVITGSAMLGGPVSTTHVVSSSIMGVGAGERPRGVRWGKAGEILFTWLVTLPCAGAVAAAIQWLQ